MELRKYQIAVLEDLGPGRRKQTVKYYEVGATSKEAALRAMADDMADMWSRRGEIVGCFQSGHFDRVVLTGSRNVTPEEAAELKARWAARSEKEAA
jgi:hypothetical protein